MKNLLSQQVVVAAAMALTCFAGQPDEPLAVPWYTIDGGGVMHSASDDGVSFVLSGTIGQADAGPSGVLALTGGDFSLTGGFWFETPPGDCNVSGAVDLADHRTFANCMLGPNEPPDEMCACFDVNDSRTVDLADFAGMQPSFRVD